MAFTLGGKILDVPELVAASREDCDIEISSGGDDPAKVIVESHHLNYLDGRAFEVLHTGSAGTTIERTGGIAITRAAIGKLRPWEIERLHLTLLATGIGMVVFFSGWALVDALVSDTPSEVDWWAYLLGLIPIALSIAIGVAVYRALVPRLVGKKVGWPVWAPEEWFYLGSYVVAEDTET